MYCHSILHETTICLIKSKLCEININECKWQELEACLFSLCSVSESVNIDENALLPSLFQYIGNIPFHRLDPKVLSTALETIGISTITKIIYFTMNPYKLFIQYAFFSGAYSSWIAAHTYTLEYVLPLIISGLSIPEATSSATMALKDIARDCQCDIKPYTGIILNASQVTNKKRYYNCNHSFYVTLPGWL